MFRPLFAFSGKQKPNDVGVTQKHKIIADVTTMFNRMLKRMQWKVPSEVFC